MSTKYKDYVDKMSGMYWKISMDADSAVAAYNTARDEAGLKYSKYTEWYSGEYVSHDEEGVTFSEDHDWDGTYETKIPYEALDPDTREDFIFKLITEEVRKAKEEAAEKRKKTKEKKAKAKERRRVQYEKLKKEFGDE